MNIIDINPNPVGSKNITIHHPGVIIVSILTITDLGAYFGSFLEIDYDIPSIVSYQLLLTITSCF